MAHNSSIQVRNDRSRFIEVTDEVLREMTRAIVDEVAPQKVILFGSTASNRKSGSSDVDLLIIEREPFDQSRSRIKEISRIRAALRRFFIPKDILVYSEPEIPALLSFPGHVIHDCLQHGRVLYERHRAS